MNSIPLKSIFRETIQHFKSNWMKLMLMSFIGYLLPLGVVAWMTVAIFSQDMDDCAPCAMAAMFVELILLIGLSVVLSCTKILIRAFCHKTLDNKFNGLGNLVSTSGIRFLPLEFTFDIFCIFIYYRFKTGITNRSSRRSTIILNIRICI